MRSSSTRRFLPGLTSAAALGALLSLPANAATLSLEKLATYEGTDRQSILEAGAKKEGVVQIYTTGTQTGPIMEAFHKKYPYIKVEPFRADAVAAMRRMMEEYKAERYVVDVASLSSGSLTALREAGTLRPSYSPEYAMIDKRYIEPNRYWAHNYHSSIGLGFNTKEVSREDAPKTYEDLLDPKWKGKMALSGRASTLNNFVGVLVLVKGADYVRKLGKQSLPIYKMSGRALSNMVVSGEVALSPQVYNSHMANSKRKGASVDWRALGPVFANIGGVALAKNPPHPHAALLYKDFMLSKTGQEMMAKLGYVSPRTDIVNRDRPKDLIDLYARPTYDKDFEVWGKLAREAFGKQKPQPKKKKK